MKHTTVKSVLKSVSRQFRLMPSNSPRYVRIYDNGKTADRYTVCFTGQIRKKCGGEFPYIGMSALPFHPQGIGQHGSSQTQIDTNQWGFAPMIGRSNHLGKRIHFKDLPPDCQKLVLSDYKEIWEL